MYVCNQQEEEEEKRGGPVIIIIIRIIIYCTEESAASRVKLHTHTNIYTDHHPSSHTPTTRLLFVEEVGTHMMCTYAYVCASHTYYLARYEREREREKDGS
jgi:hypothetical protein